MGGDNRRAGEDLVLGDLRQLPEPRVREHRIQRQVDVEHWDDRHVLGHEIVHSFQVERGSSISESRWALFESTG